MVYVMQNGKRGYINVLSVALMFVGGERGDGTFNDKGEPVNRIDTVQYEMKLPGGAKRTIEGSYNGFLQDAKEVGLHASTAIALAMDKRIGGQNDQRRKPVEYYHEGKLLSFNPWTQNKLEEPATVQQKNAAVCAAS
jgi:hypothetical protein